ncbi:MAG: peptidoglycan DD-metalloendopeptidase family protein [Steroidobacteraceae bacterium]
MKHALPLLALGLWFATLALPAAQPDRARTEANLRSLKERIERIQRQVQEDAAEKDRLTRDLRAAEQSVSKAQGELGKVRTQRTETSAERARLQAERTRHQAERDRTQADLAQQLRSAYMMGRSEPLKMLLNQRSLSSFQRNLTYYGYFGRDRAAKIGIITKNIAEIDELARRIEEQDNELAQLELQRQRKVQELDKARKSRGQVLASLTAESRNRGAQLKRLQQQQQQLENLLTELRRATEATPFDPNDPFARLQGKLSWPVAGKLEVTYGETIAGGLRSNGIEIAADRGTPVRAVHEGRVIFADWLSGRGLLIILDHGNGYLSLYGHNEQLFKQAGATVQAGEAIAAAGDSGGRARPGLYFEIRRAGKPVNPSGWFKSPSPPP